MSWSGGPGTCTCLHSVWGAHCCLLCCGATAESVKRKTTCPHFTAVRNRSLPPDIGSHHQIELDWQRRNELINYLGFNPHVREIPYFLFWLFLKPSLNEFSSIFSHFFRPIITDEKLEQFEERKGLPLPTCLWWGPYIMGNVYYWSQTTNKIHSLVLPS